MTTIHLDTRQGTLCSTSWRAAIVTSGDMRDVTCKRCLRRFDVEMDEEWSEALDRRRIAAYAEAAAFLDADRLWSLIPDGQTPTDRLVRELLGSVLVCIAEHQREDVAA